MVFNSHKAVQHVLQVQGDGGEVTFSFLETLEGNCCLVFFVFSGFLLVFCTYQNEKKGNTFDFVEFFLFFVTRNEVLLNHFIKRENMS